MLGRSTAHLLFTLRGKMFREAHAPLLPAWPATGSTVTARTGGLRGRQPLRRGTSFACPIPGAPAVTCTRHRAGRALPTARAFPHPPANPATQLPKHLRRPGCACAVWPVGGTANAVAAERGCQRARSRSFAEGSVAVLSQPPEVSSAAPSVRPGSSPGTQARGGRRGSSARGSHGLGGAGAGRGAVRAAGGAARPRGPLLGGRVLLQGGPGAGPGAEGTGALGVAVPRPAVPLAAGARLRGQACPRPRVRPAAGLVAALGSLLAGESPADHS